MREMANVGPSLLLPGEIFLLRKKPRGFLYVKQNIAVSGLTEHCPIFHFPPFVRSFVRPSQACHINLLDILTVYTMKTIYFLNAYHLGW